MRKLPLHTLFAAIAVLLMFAFTTLSGCGGGAGLTLTGGSVPIGGRVITGSVVLPDSTPATNIVVTVRSLSGGALLQTTTTDSFGRFTATGIPVTSGISIVATQPPSSSLEAIVPLSDLSTNPDRPLEIGNVTALSTLVSAAIRLEQKQAPEDSEDIASGQRDHFNTQVSNSGFSQEAQHQFISDSAVLMSQAQKLFLPVTNMELKSFIANPNSNTASTALNGLLGYVRGAHERETHLKGSLKNGLIASQLSGKTYSPDKIALALQSAGENGASASTVSAASLSERGELSELANLGNGITSFEATVIAADVRAHGGFQLERDSLEKFLNTLLKN